LGQMASPPEAPPACSLRQLVTSALFGGISFAILGAVGNFRRAPLPVALNVLTAMHQKLSTPGSLTLGQIFLIPLTTGAIGTVIGGYIGYRECQMEKEFRDKWIDKQKTSPKEDQKEGS